MITATVRLVHVPEWLVNGSWVARVKGQNLTAFMPVRQREATFQVSPLTTLGKPWDWFTVNVWDQPDTSGKGTEIQATGVEFRQGELWEVDLAAKTLRPVPDSRWLRHAAIGLVLGAVSYAGVRLVARRR